MKYLLTCSILLFSITILKSQTNSNGKPLIVSAFNSPVYKINSTSNNIRLTFYNNYSLLLNSSQVNIIVTCINKSKNWAEINRTKNLSFSKSLGKFKNKTDDVSIYFMASGGDYWTVSISVYNTEKKMLAGLILANDFAFNKFPIIKFLEDLNNANVSERQKNIDRIFK